MLADEGGGGLPASGLVVTIGAEIPPPAPPRVFRPLVACTAQPPAGRRHAFSRVLSGCCCGRRVARALAFNWARFDPYSASAQNKLDSSPENSRMFDELISFSLLTAYGEHDLFSHFSALLLLPSNILLVN